MAEMTIPEAAAALGVSTDTIRRRIIRGELRARRDERGRYLVTIEGPPTATAQGPVAAEQAHLRLELDYSRQILEELRHQRKILEDQLEAARRASQEDGAGGAEQRRMMGDVHIQVYGEVRGWPRRRRGRRRRRPEG